MQKKLYWCGDDCFRGCILRRIFSELGFQVLIPVGAPNFSTGKLPKKGSTFKLLDVSRFLARKDCIELDVVDEKLGVNRAGRGDIDFAVVLRGGEAFVAEVKTRLIPRSIKYYGIKIARLMLQYHLDEPLEAEKAWSQLVSAGIVKPPRPRGKRGYDNPASVAELARSIVGFHIMQPSYKPIVPGVVTLCYARPLLNDMLRFINNTSRYLKRCGLEVGEPVVLVLYPPNFTSHPSSIEVRCAGNNCSRLGLRERRVFQLTLKECPKYYGCNECEYKQVCSVFCQIEK